VQLHTPVSGTYTLLATYERPFKPQGETLTFTGARPLDAASEQGHTVVVSTYQFNVQPVSVSSSLTPLEPGEIPPEQRLFFDAPILAAYRYTTRPFNLQLALQPLAQGETINQVVDRASILTHITREGQVVTEARYFVKNKGGPHLRLSLPEGTKLWSTIVNSNVVVPIVAGHTNMIPIPQRSDPNMLNELRIKMATRSKSPTKITVAAPVLAAPVLLTEWCIQPDEGMKLVYKGGTVTPAGGIVDLSGFAGLRRMLSQPEGWRTGAIVAVALLLALLSVTSLRLTSCEGIPRFGLGRLLGGLIGVGAGMAAIALLFWLATEAKFSCTPSERMLRFVVPIQQSDVALTVQVSNVSERLSAVSLVWCVWPGLVGLVLWAWTHLTSREWLARNGTTIGWALVFWGSLRLPDGGTAFFVVACLFVALQLLLPALKHWIAAAKRATAKSKTTAGAAAATSSALLIGALLSGPNAFSAEPAKATAPQAESILHQVRVEEGFVLGNAKINWQASKGQVLPLIHTPGVITKADFPSGSGRLVQIPTASRPTQGFLAEKTGAIAVSYTH
ncbi:MAG: hypothetical protein N3G20_02320, partial [Verrucomicrobiae bacterium]|nr:hypothetical protein [Verrucomicrobiae bacterium]